MGNGKRAITLAEIRESNAAHGFHFFDRETMSFFRSRTVGGPVEGPGGVYFVTSERCGDMARRYTVRRFDPSTGAAETADLADGLSSFLTFATGRVAAQYARKLASTPILNEGKKPESVT